MANKLNQWRQAKKYQAKLNFLAKVRRQIEPKLNAITAAEDSLGNGVTSSLDNSPEGYGAFVLRFVVVGQPVRIESFPDLLTENAPCFPRIRKGTKNLGKNWC